MADKHETRVPEVLDETPQILDRGPDAVAVGTHRLGREVVTALVGGDGEMVRAELSKLCPERVVKLGEAVEEDDEGPVPHVAVMELDPVHRRGGVLYLSVTGSPAVANRE